MTDLVNREECAVLDKDITAPEGRGRSGVFVRRVSVTTSIVLAFLVVGAFYPVIRLEVMTRTGVSSALIGSWQDILVAITLGLTVLCGHRSVFKNDSLTLTLCMLVAGGLLSALVAIISNRGIIPMVYAARLTYMPVAFFFVGRWLSVRGREVQRIYVTLATVCVVSALVGVLFSYVFQEYWMSLIILNAQERGWGLDAIAREGGLRMTGAFLDPVSFGTVCAWGVVLNMSIMEYRRKRLQRVLCFAGMILCLLGTLLSLTRGAWFSLLVAIGALVVLSTRRWFYVRVITVVGILAAGILSVGAIRQLASVSQEVELLGRTWQKTVEERNVQRDWMWADTVEAFRREPWGYGLGSVGHIGERFRREFPSNAPVITDGWYLKVLAEGGVVLLAGFVCFQVAVLRTLLGQILKRQDCVRPFRIVTLAMLLAAHFQAVTTNLWDFYYLSHVLWLLLGLATRSD